MPHLNVDFVRFSRFIMSAPCVYQQTGFPFKKSKILAISAADNGGFC
jgi:hypothetical protein